MLIREPHSPEFVLRSGAANKILLVKLFKYKSKLIKAKVID